LRERGEKNCQNPGTQPLSGGKASHCHRPRIRGEWHVGHS
jgi:hypothetical protein